MKFLAIPPFRMSLVIAAMLLIGICDDLQSEDSVELLNGVQLQGTITGIRKQQKEFDFQYTVGGTVVDQTLPYGKVHAVTMSGKRFVITPMPVPVASDDSPDGPAQRSEREVKELIERIGPTEPDWMAETDMNHPRSLDLSWPIKAEGPWNESKNIGQYIWGRVNPNVARWKPGIKLVRHCVDLHDADLQRQIRDMEKLGVMYFQLLQDYPRAAYWLQKANAQPNTMPGIHLAECYWRLGNQAMAMNAMRGRNLNVGAIKLFGDMGELKRALDITRSYENSPQNNEAWLNCGDALRTAGKMDQAIQYYQKVIDQNRARNQEYLNRYKGRAANSIESIRSLEQANVRNVADGTYNAAALGYNGSLEVAVTVVDAKITKVEVTKHQEKQFYAALDDTPKQILDEQSILNIDATSGATITSQAIVNATTKALAQGAK